MANIVLVHIGNNLPEYIFDCVFQIILVSPKSKIYIILNDILINQFKHRFLNLNVNLYLLFDYDYDNITYISSESLNVPQKYLEAHDKFSSMQSFRDKFWISTTTRFFYIESFMKKYDITNIFHIENDVMLYEDLSILKLKDSLHMLKDSPNRIIPSLIYIPNSDIIQLLNTHIVKTLQSSSKFLNDMELLCTFTENVCYFPTGIHNNEKYVIDGAAIGQYLGGIDPRNIPAYSVPSNIIQITYNNPTKGFINETSDLKMNKCSITRKMKNNNNTIIPLYFYHLNDAPIYNLHIHSKQLYQFSSIFDIKFNDLITNDRILQNKKFQSTNINNVYRKDDVIYTSNLQVIDLISNMYNTTNILPIPVLNYNNNELYKFYVIMSKIYNMKKEFNLYKEDEIDLIKMSKHRFCKWNNQWDCFYMGVIPITDNDNIVNMLENINLPCYKINNISVVNDNIFDEKLYKEILKKSKLYTNNALKMNTYF